MSKAMLSLVVVGAAAGAADQTTLKLRTLDPQTGGIAAVGGGLTQTWTEENQRGTQARYYSSGGQAFVLKYNAHQGRVRIYRLTNDNQLGPAVTHYIHTKLRGTNIDVAATFPVPVLFVHDPFVGTIRRFRLESDGGMDFDNVVEAQNAAWRDKNLFEVYARGNSWSLFALETATGRVAIGNINGQVTATADWTSGYTTVDHLTAGDRTFRLLYKAAGSPYLQRGEAGEDEGRVIVQRVGADGLPEDETQRLLIEPGWTHLRFVVRPRPGQSTQYSILAYNRKSGLYSAFPFLVPQGLGVFLPAQFGALDTVTSDLQLYVLGNEPRLLALADDDVPVFAPEEVERMGRDIHDALRDKVVGYQFMVAQSGRVIFSRAWGISRRGNPDTAMTLRTRQDLGSVTKMITTVTALKLAEEGVGGLTLNAPASRFLASVPAGSWTHNRTVADLLRHTTGVNEDGANQCVRGNGYGMNCEAFWAAEPNVLCRAQGCARSYNNSNTVGVRKVIEYVAGISTSEEMVTETHQQWARRANLDFDDGSAPESNAFSCRIPHQTLYYGRCSNGSNACFERNGLYWHEAPRFTDAEQVWSFNCSAGAWQASSRQMIEFLIGIRYGKFLGPEASERLLITGERDGYGDRTAMGWEPPWDAGDTLQLGKSGYDAEGPVATNAYITRLPDNVEAVLLVNTASPGTSGLVQAAYRRAKEDDADDREAVPSYTQVVSTDAEDTPEMAGVDRVAVGTLANSEPANSTFNMRYVVAGRDSAERLKLTVWRVNERGGVSAFGSAYLPGTVQNLAVSDGDAFVTAVQNPQGRLRVDAWTVNPGNLNMVARQGSATGPVIRRVAVAKTAGSGLALGRVVTAVRDQDDRLQLQVWDFDNQSDGVVARGNHTSTAEVREVAIKTLDYGNTWSSTSRFVTAVQNAEGRLAVAVWEVNGAGVLERLSVEETGLAVTSVAARRNRIAIGRWSNATFYVAFLTSGGPMKLLSYRVNSAGVLTREQEFTTSKTKTEVAASGRTTVARDDEGNLEVVRWSIAGTGIRVSGSEKLGAVEEVAAAGDVFGAYTYGNTNALRVRSWHVVE